MSIFRKKVPQACPKCGDADSRNLVTAEEPPPEEPRQRTASARGPIGPGVTLRRGKRKKYFHCGKCGFEMKY